MSSWSLERTVSRIWQDCSRPPVRWDDVRLTAEGRVNLPNMDPPETQYVAVGDADVAYQVVGDSSLDLLYCFGLGSHIEMAWDVPRIAEFLNRLAVFSRLVFFDRRGTGASDAVPFKAMPTWEEWTEDIAGVLGASGLERTAILATLEAGPIALRYAAMHPKSSAPSFLSTHRPDFWRQTITRSE